MAACENETEVGRRVIADTGDHTISVSPGGHEPRVYSVHTRDGTWVGSTGDRLLAWLLLEAAEAVEAESKGAVS